MIKFFVVATMLLSVCMVVSVGQQLVLWYIIETQDSDISEFSDVVFTAIKPGNWGKFKSAPASSELQAANLGLLQVAVNEPKSYSICYKRIIIECGQSKKTSKNIDVAICMFYTFICPRVYVAFILDMIIAFNKIINNSRPPAWYFSLTRTGNKEFIIVGLILKCILFEISYIAILASILTYWIGWNFLNKMCSVFICSYKSDSWTIKITSMQGSFLYRLQCRAVDM